MKKAKLLTIFIFAIFIAVINLITINGVKFKNNNQMQTNNMHLDISDVTVEAQDPGQIKGKHYAEGYVDLNNPDKSNTFSEFRVFLFLPNKIPNQKQLQLKETPSDFGKHKHIIITGLHDGKNQLYYEVAYKDKAGMPIIQRCHHALYVTIQNEPHKKNLAAIIVPSVIVPLVVIGIAGGIYYYIDSKKKQKKLEKTDIQKMTIND